MAEKVLGKVGGPDAEGDAGDDIGGIVRGDDDAGGGDETADEK